MNFSTKIIMTTICLIGLVGCVHKRKHYTSSTSGSKVMTQQSNVPRYDPNNPVVNAPLPALQAPAVDNVDWEPNEGVLVRAGDLLMQQKRDNGGVTPAREAMSLNLQNQMGLSADQALQVIDELGV
jgi:hypothetical protein